MKTLITFVLFCFLTCSLKAQTSVTNKVKQESLKEVRSAKDILLSTIDPAVTKIEFTYIRRNTLAEDKTRITGFVKNIGGKDYKSNPNQQIIQLWEIRTPVDKQMLKQQSFTNLSSGQEIKIEFDIPAISSKNEFPPDYQVVIVYDPDILIDANTNNDDANNKNNSLTKNPRN